jgi:acetyl-CoA C-acetyltransferase
VFRDVPAADLAAAVIRELVARSGIEPDGVHDVILGQCYPSGEAPAIGRVAALDAGLDVAVPGRQVDRRCGSGLQAVLDACMQVQTGVAGLVIAGGVESMSQVEHYAPALRWGARGSAVLEDRLIRSRVTAGGLNFPVPGGMIETAENLRREYGIPREAQDALALESHRRAVAAGDDGTFAEEIVPVVMPARRGGGTASVERDEHPRADASAQSLAGLRPVMAADDPEATVTAGNSSGQNDGAAACIVASRERAEALGLRPLARLASWAVAGVPPRTMGIGPIPASAAALERAGITLGDVDVIELNEAFGSQVLAVLREWSLDPADERLNPHGSGIALGHPVGATGARILATLLRELERRGGRYGLETMCIGGGQGLAAVFERVD